MPPSRALPLRVCAVSLRTCAGLWRTTLPHRSKKRSKQYLYYVKFSLLEKGEPLSGSVKALKKMTVLGHKTIIRLIDNTPPLYLTGWPRADSDVILCANVEFVMRAFGAWRIYDIPVLRTKYLVLVSGWQFREDLFYSVVCRAFKTILTAKVSVEEYSLRILTSSDLYTCSLYDLEVFVVSGCGFGNKSYVLQSS